MPQAFFTLGQLVVETGDVFFAADIAFQWDDLAVHVVAVIFFGHCVELFSGAAYDVDSGAVDGEGLCDHQTDAGTST
jgi:hypothetical protein